MEILVKLVLILILIFLTLFLSIFLEGGFYLLLIFVFKISIYAWNFNESNTFEFSLLDTNEEFSDPIRSIKKIHKVGLTITIIIFSIGIYNNNNISFYPLGNSFIEIVIGIAFCLIGLAIINSFIAHQRKKRITYQVIERIKPAYNPFDKIERLIKENEQNLTHNDLLSIKAYREKLAKKPDIYIRKVIMFEYFLFNNFPKVKIGNIEIRNIIDVKRTFN